jgi:addiction module HigA family antidote
MNIHPGEILAEEFLEPLGISMSALARDLNVPPNRITAIIKGQRSVSADSAHRLAAYFGTTSQFWMNLQIEFDLREARRLHAKEYADIKGPRSGRVESGNVEDAQAASPNAPSHHN